MHNSRVEVGQKSWEQVWWTSSSNYDDEVNLGTRCSTVDAFRSPRDGAGDGGGKFDSAEKTVDRSSHRKAGLICKQKN